MKTFQCKFCEKDFIRNTKANNKQFCSAFCREESYKEKKKQSTRKYIDKKVGGFVQGKIKCLECGLYYHKVLTHVIQRHEMTGEEYRERHGLYHSKSLVSEDVKEIHRQIAFNNPEVIEINLLKKGKKTRFTKGKVYQYKRRPQHIQELKQRFKNITN
jgi:hypothetical protein